MPILLDRGRHARKEHRHNGQFTPSFEWNGPLGSAIQWRAKTQSVEDVLNWASGLAQADTLTAILAGGKAMELTAEEKRLCKERADGAEAYRASLATEDQRSIFYANVGGSTLAYYSASLQERLSQRRFSQNETPEQLACKMLSAAAKAFLYCPHPFLLYGFAGTITRVAGIETARPFLEKFLTLQSTAELDDVTRAFWPGVQTDIDTAIAIARTVLSITSRAQQSSETPAERVPAHPSAGRSLGS